MNSTVKTLATTTPASLLNESSIGSSNLTDPDFFLYEDTETIQFLRILSWVLQMLTYLILVYALVQRSPREMAAYRWYILLNCTHALMMRIFDVSCQPFRPTNFAINMSNGVCKYLHTSKTMTMIIFYLDLQLMSGFIYTLTLQFLFRFVQSTNMWVKTFSNMYFYFAGYVIFQLIMFLADFFSFDTYVWVNDGTEWKKGVYDPNPNVTFVFGMDTTSPESELALAIIQAVTGLIPLTIAILSIIGSYTALLWFKKSNIQISPVAQQLYKKLVNVLFIDLLIFVFFAIAPTLIYTHIDSESFYASVLSMLPEYYPLLINLIYFVFIKPFRNIIIEPIQNCKNADGAHSSNSVQDSNNTYL